MEIERCESAYENLGGFYHEIKEGSLYPPHLGYSEFTTSSSSLGFETETFSELFFSSSSSSSDEDLPSLIGPKTPGILYKISRQLDKVPRYISTRQHAEEREDFLDVSDDTEELLNLQSSVENMIEKISYEEKLFFRNNSDCLVPTRISKLENENKLVLTGDSSDPVQSLSLIENQISNLIKEVEKEEEAILRTIKNKSESVPDVKPIYDDIYSSSSDSSNEYDFPRINLKVGRSFGTSTIDIRASGGFLRRRHINRSLPNMSEHFSTPSFDLFENGQIYPSSSIEYITPRKGLGFVNSGYCIWTSDEDLLEEGKSACGCVFLLKVFFFLNELKGFYSGFDD